MWIGPDYLGAIILPTIYRSCTNYYNIHVHSTRSSIYGTTCTGTCTMNGTGMYYRVRMNAMYRQYYYEHAEGIRVL